MCFELEYNHSSSLYSLLKISKILQLVQLNDQKTMFKNNGSKNRSLQGQTKAFGKPFLNLPSHHTEGQYKSLQELA